MVGDENPRFGGGAMDLPKVTSRKEQPEARRDER
jgi:hypothetical protein